MLPGVHDLYPSVNLGLFWPLLGVASFAALIGGYIAVRWLLTQMALARQRRLLELSKPKKDELIANALAEIKRVEQAVLSGTMTPDAGAAKVSEVARGTFDILMNHSTLRSARYEVASKNLQTMTEMLDANYPVNFNPPNQPASFPPVSTQAIKVVESCR